MKLLYPSLVGNIAALLVVGLASAQSPSSVPHHDHAATASDSDTQAEPANHNQQLTFTGCVMGHKDVLDALGAPSGKAAGYFLVDAGIVNHHQNAGGMLAPSHDPSATHAHDAPQTATSGRVVPASVDVRRERIADSLLFKLTGIPPEQLTKMKGKRVQVTGHVDATELIDAPPTDANRRTTVVPDAATLVVMAVDAVEGACQKR